MRRAILLSGLLALAGCGDVDTGSGGDTTDVNFTRGLAYVSNGDIYVADASDFENKTQRLTTDGSNGQPSVSQDGKQVAYVHTDTSNQQSIFRVTTSGGTPATLVAASAVSFGGLAWAADGSKLYFTESGGIAVVNADGSGQSFVVQPGATSLASPSVTSSGIVWAASSGGFQQVVGGSQTVSVGSAQVLSGEISPDGSTLVYADGTTHQLFVQAVAGGAATQLTAFSDGQQSEPTWSSDGATIYFVSNTGGSDRIYSLPKASNMAASATLVQVGDEPSWGG